MASHSRLSLCMIVRNEAKNLPLCIHSVKSVMDEIIVVDTGSTDGTKEIARQLGADVFDFPWCDDFSAARNESIKHATGDYILWLDADDRVDTPEVRKLSLLKKMLPWKKNKAYYLVVNNQSPLDGETFFHQFRIFPNIPGALFEGRVHEQIFHRLNRLGVEQVQTDIVIGHTGYHDVAAVKKKSERNLKIIEKELESEPDNSVLNFNAARTLGGMGRQAEAVVHLKKVTENQQIREREKEFFLAAALNLGKLYVDLAWCDQAVSIFQELCNSFPKNGLVRFFYGESLFLAKDYERAREELRESLLHPIEVGLFPINLKKIRHHQHYLLQQCYLETGEIELAVEMGLKFPNLCRDDSKILEARGLLALKKSQFNEAVEYYERAIQEGGASDSNYANLGLAYRKLGRQGEAEEALLKAMEINPRRVEALTNLGQLYDQKKEHPKAIDYFTRALDLAPDLIDVRLSLSKIYFRLLELEKLVDQCDSLLAELGLPRDLTLNNFEELSSLYRKVGEALENQGRKGLSLMAYQVCFLISPSKEVLEKIASSAPSSEFLNVCLEEITESLQFHGEGTEKRVTIEAGPG